MLLLTSPHPFGGRQQQALHPEEWFCIAVVICLYFSVSWWIPFKAFAKWGRGGGSTKVLRFLIYLLIYFDVEIAMLSN